MLGLGSVELVMCGRVIQKSGPHEVWYSKEWDDAPMPHSIFFTKDGHA